MIIFICISIDSYIVVCVSDAIELLCFLSFILSCCTFVFLSFAKMINDEWKEKKRQNIKTVDFSLTFRIKRLITLLPRQEKEKKKSFP